VGARGSYVEQPPCLQSKRLLLLRARRGLEAVTERASAIVVISSLLIS
jgi:hypothetical protein